MEADWCEGLKPCGSSCDLASKSVLLALPLRYYSTLSFPNSLMRCYRHARMDHMLTRAAEMPVWSLDLDREIMSSTKRCLCRRPIAAHRMSVCTGSCEQVCEVHCGNIVLMA